VLNEDAARPPAATLAAQQLRLDAWRLDYNNDRPHEALGQRCPATLCTPSPRASRSDGGLGLSRRAPGQAGQQQRLHQMARQTVYLTEALARQNVALAQNDDGDWSIRFRQFSLAMLSDTTNMIRHCGLGPPVRRHPRQPPTRWLTVIRVVFGHRADPARPDPS
jgi:putative transposase